MRRRLLVATSVVFLVLSAVSSHAQSSISGTGGTVETDVDTALTTAVKLTATSSSSPDVTVKTGPASTSKFKILNASNSELMRVQSDGFVGIGVTAPPKMLTVGKDIATNTTEMLVQNRATTGDTAGAIFRSIGDTAQMQFGSWGSSRTTTRFGTSVGGWNEAIGVTGNGIIYGTYNNAPVRIGTNAIRAI